MLGGEKRFNDRLCWVLVLPLAFFALWAVDLIFLGVEVVFEGDRPGSATWWVAPLMSLAGGFAAVRMGASVAPYRKPRAAIGVGMLYGAATLWSAVSRARAGAGAPWCAAFAALGLAGAALGWAASRGLRDDYADAEERKA